MNIEYKEILPPTYLKDYIKYFWSYEYNNEDYEITVLPDACFDLVVDYENGIFQGIYLTGIWTVPKKLLVTKGTRLIAIRFKLLAAEYIFNNETKKLLESMETLPKNFWNIDSSEMSDFESFRREVINIIGSKINNIDNRKIELFDLIYNKKIYRVDEISERLCWSPRQINRYFTKKFGFPIKKFLIMVRCQDSYEHIAKGDLYPSSEYADQAHFIREVKKYTNETPRQLYKNENDRFIQLTQLRKD